MPPYATIATHKQTQQAALTKLDRCLQELELQGQQRIQPLEQIAETLDIDTLKSVVFDIENAVKTYRQARKELYRIQS